ncbi:MAG: metalloregulator ArsR/SmtB family transcription factor [Candidatus Moranbacteria bacterium]|nr:metalloregulator ArsR/SmtB family transcription factor [Candidatus Moranbacteria bacterium]
MNFKCCAKISAEAGNVKKTYDFLRAVADPNRLKILCVLQGGSKCVCEIISAVGISDKLASHHLKQLKKVGLLIEKREGNFIYYGLDRKAIRNYKSLFNEIIK